MHKLLQRQLKKTGATVNEKFLSLVDQAYVDADEDRRLLEHSLEISSDEMKKLYKKLAIHAQEQLKASEDRYDALTYELRNHYFFYAYDCNFLFTYLSDSITNIAGYTKEELLGTAFTNYFTKDQVNHNIQQLSQKIIDGEIVEPHVVNIFHKNKTNLYLEVSSYPIYDANGKFIEVKGIARNVTQEYKAQQKLHFLSNHDTLTGIANRHSLYNKLEYIITDSKRNTKNFSLLYIDLDEFKAVNDTYGHDTGDILLKDVTSRTQLEIRQNDIFARIGGDEFIIVLTDVDKDFISKIAQNILSSLVKPFMIYEQTINISVSIGIATYPKDGEDIDSLLKNADNAMYSIKKSGKNNFTHA
jgi:diguanylate cyclase (GGDEF)-like protein/PAS domain S-box-containing protein